MKNIPIYDLFNKVALDTFRPLHETKDGNMYIFVAIDHYSKWCEARLVKDHDAATITRFLEEEIICRFGVPIFIFTDNGGEWMAEFDMMCKKYGITHQFTTPQWPQCNRMVERMIKILKNGSSIVIY
jgi:transposase-like protein